MVTMRDVADAAGVSQAAVSYAYNRPDKLSAAQRERILQIAASMGYHGPDAAGRMLRGGVVGALGVMVMDTLKYAFTDPSNLILMQGIAEVGQLADVAVTLLPSPRGGKGMPADELARKQAMSALRGLVDGVLVHNLPVGHAGVDALVARGIPLVIVDAPRVEGASFVGIDDHEAAYRAASYLAVLGHRRFGILVDRLRPDGHSGDVTLNRVRRAVDPVAQARVNGYLAALKAADIDPRSVAIVEAGGFEPDHYDHAARSVIAHHAPTAILAMSDVLAASVIRVAEEQRLRIPDDLSIVGFDDAPDAAALGLTTIAQPMFEKGRLAAELLLKTIEDGSIESRILDTQLVVRRSSGPPPGRRARSRGR